MVTFRYSCLVLVFLSIFIELVVVSFGFQEISHIDGSTNRCTRTRLTRLTDVFGSNNLTEWRCEMYGFSTFSCERLRSGLIPVDDVFFPQIEEICCPGSYTDESGECQSPCPRGRYGQDCLLTCTCVHATGICNSEDGRCDCNEGWTGRDCDARCPPGYYGRNCQETTLSCMNGGINDPSTGVCLCPVTHHGIHCEQICSTKTCTVECGKCSRSATHFCDTVVSVCRCKDGWQGYYCTEPCEIGWKGEFCAEECCSKNGIYITESKSCKCNDGYVGNDCERKCDEGRYGSNCTLNCDCVGCDHVTGACRECPPGLIGDRCSIPCPDQTWGTTCNHTCSCNTGEECDVFSGACEKLVKSKQQAKTKQGSIFNPKFNMKGVLATIGGVAFLVMVVLVLVISTKYLARKRNPEMENKSFPSLNTKPENKKFADHHIDYGKEDTNSLYQEIDEYPSRYTKPALPSMPPGIPNDQPKYERVLTNYDPDYLVPDVK